MYVYQHYQYVLIRLSVTDVPVAGQTYIERICSCIINYNMVLADAELQQMNKGLSNVYYILHTLSSITYVASVPTIHIQ